MRSFIAIAAIFAAVNANGHDDHNDDWNKDMDHGMDHGMDHNDWNHDGTTSGGHHGGDMDWKDMECMMSGVCDSAVSLGASAAALAATMAVLM